MKMKISFTFVFLILFFSIIYMLLPDMIRERVISNEIAAEGALRALYNLQNQFKEAKLKDRDKDEIGEYGYYVELAGLVPIPVGTEFKKAPNPFVNAVFGITSKQNGGIAEKNGYFFKIYLPSDESPKGETGKQISPLTQFPPTEKESKEINSQEESWCAYAWPKEAGEKAKKTFFINEFGLVFATSNIPIGTNNFYYNGTIRMPTVFDVYETNTGNDLKGEIVIGTPTKNGLIWNPTS